jgi:uncharacterized protein DUF7009
MKLRIKGNSLRLRVSRSELASFLEGNKIEETIHFTPSPEDRLTYALDSASQTSSVRVEYSRQMVTVILSLDQARIWAAEDEVGVYSTVDIGSEGSLEVMIEKDFACIDRSDEDNQDTFANPHAGATCN